MPLSSEVLDILNSVIVTEEDQAAFSAGYELAKDPANSASVGGCVDGRRGGVHIQINKEDQSGTWLEDKLLPRNQESVLIEDPSFVLGGIVAALESKVAGADN